MNAVNGKIIQWKIFLNQPKSQLIRKHVPSKNNLTTNIGFTLLLIGFHSFEKENMINKFKCLYSTLHQIKHGIKAIMDANNAPLRIQ